MFLFFIKPIKKYIFYFQLRVWRLESDFKTGHIFELNKLFSTGNKMYIRFGNQNRKWKAADPFYFNINEATRFLLLSAAKARGIQLMKEVRKNCHIVRSNSTSSGNKDATDTASTVNNVRFYVPTLLKVHKRRPQNLKKSPKLPK